MIITELGEEKRPLWDNFVHAQPNALPQHLSGWRDVIQKTYGYKTHYLMAQEGEHVVGVLPLFGIKSYLFGRSVRTMPGGLAADCEDTAVSLIEAGKAWATQQSANRFTLADSRQQYTTPTLATTSEHVFWRNPLHADQDTQWKSLHSNIRRQVKIARRNHLSVTIDRTGDLLPVFYDLFVLFAHQNGTPLFGRNFLENIIATFPNNFNIAVVYEGKRPLGAYFQLELGGTMYGQWGATLRQHLPKRPVYLAYWEIMCDAIQNSFHTLDMGRSPQASNANHFKSQWGGESHAVYQHSASLLGVSPKQQPESKTGKALLVSRYWPLLPLPLARLLGPKLRRHVPFA